MERGHTACPRPSKWGPGEGQDADLRRAGDAAVPEPGLYTGRLSDCLASDRRRRAAALRWPIEAYVVRACESRSGPELGSNGLRARHERAHLLDREPARRLAVAAVGGKPQLARARTDRSSLADPRRRRSPASPGRDAFTSMTPATRILSPPCSAQSSVSHIERFANSRLSASSRQVAEVRRERRVRAIRRRRAGRGSCRSRGGAMSSRPRPRGRRW